MLAGRFGTACRAVASNRLWRIGVRDILGAAKQLKEDLVRTRGRVGWTTAAIFLVVLSPSLFRVSGNTPEAARTSELTAMVAVGPQYDSTHVYVAPKDFAPFVASIVATFGGTAGKEGIFTVTPTPSSTMSQLVMTPEGTFSVFGYKTPIPYPFGLERTGYLVTDMDEAIRAARATGAGVVVTPFKDAIGRDAIIEWPGGVYTQLYWHTTAPHYEELTTIPENRVYISPDAANAFARSFLSYSHGKMVSDDKKAPGIEIGHPDETYRRIRIESNFGKLTALVTDGHLPYPYGREIMGYQVKDIESTLTRAKRSGASVLVAPYEADGRMAAMVEFPGGFVAEIHSSK